MRVKSSPPLSWVGAATGPDLTLDIGAQSWLSRAAGGPPSAAAVPDSGFISRQKNLHAPGHHASLSCLGAFLCDFWVPFTDLSYSDIFPPRPDVSEQLIAFRPHLHPGPGHPQPPTGSRHRGIVHAGYHLSLNGRGVWQI